MQVGARSLLAASLLVAWVASCSLNEHGLGSTGGGQATGVAGAPMGTAGNAGAGGTIVGPTGGGGTTSFGGSSGAGNESGASGDTAGAAGGSSGTTGDTAGAGGDTAGAGGDTTGTAGATPTGGDSGAAGAGANGGAGGGTAGAGGSAGSGGVVAAGGGSGAGGSGAAGSAAPDPGCSDGTREGYLDTTMYPKIAACAGAWDTPGLDSTDSRTPQCDRRAGNDGDKVDGRGCSAADLCESGWHVCENAHAVSVATMGAGCDDAVAPANGKPVFYVTRQHATGLVCDNSTNASGTNNLYGCGNIGSAADKSSCAPFTRMLRDSDCLLNSPWMCSDGPNGTSQDELDVVTKSGPSRGGVLCCHD